jgi:hypothetical protein
MICIGYGAGLGATATNAPVTDSNGILVGYQSNRSVVSATELSNYIGIGYQVLIDKSNQVKIGNSSITENIFYGNFGIGGATSWGTSATKTLAVPTGTDPSSSPADCFQMYSSDEVAGNAVPTFRTEEGVVVKLNQSLLDTDSVIFGTSAVRGTTGGLVLKTAEATANITAATSVTITLNVPTGAIIHGCQLRVDAALAAGETWNAAYSGGSPQTIIHEGAVAANTKYNSAYESLITAGTLAAQAAWAANVATAATNITIQRHSNPGVDSFTAQGTIRAIVYYYDFTTMASL